MRSQTTEADVAACEAAAWGAANKDGYTPLHWLCRKDSLTGALMAEAGKAGLAEAGEAAWAAPDKDGKTPLHYICIKESLSGELMIELSKAGLAGQLMIEATRSKKVARVKALVGVLCDAPELVLRFATLRHSLRELFEAGLGAQAVRLLSEGGLRTVPSLALVAGMVPDVDPAEGCAAASGTPQVHESAALMQ